MYGGKSRSVQLGETTAIRGNEQVAIERPTSPLPIPVCEQIVGKPCQIPDWPTILDYALSSVSRNEFKTYVRSGDTNCMQLLETISICCTAKQWFGVLAVLGEHLETEFAAWHICPVLGGLGVSAKNGENGDLQIHICDDDSGHARISSLGGLVASMGKLA
ncbi:hypothetical protein BKA67DRAFT_648636 [Truncatella angustata]|uniref:Uncharacterized protein n=1 Tax=Truncatella angustata TaxID=152316 RepID=A0A9P8UEV6_9PEZI|nr:uncharacterized protein BKA67DRAFT_648636 [Truncatella angustata]KAH6648627.1 hypothetical protein BKA67DRAFT_648636 [Truncatella angustata]